MTQSTVFDAPNQAAPPARPTTGPRSSEQMGGIFGAGVAEPPTRRPAVTKSSVEGGIFSSESAYGQMDAYPEPPRSARGPKPELSSHVAGQAITRDNGFSLFQGEGTAPLSEVNTARANFNKPSIEGGIFGAPPPMSKPGIVRGNPNQSSIPGGIFG